MIRLTFVDPDGKRAEFGARVGETVMTVARQNGVAGIEAECGGALACGTCHVYVEPSSVSYLPRASALEEELLGVVAAERRKESRLACQIILPDGLEALVIHVPGTQY